MSESPQSTIAQSVGRTAQIIAFALITGVLVFAAIAYFVAKGKPAAFPIVSYMGVGFAVINLTMRFVVPAYLVSMQKRSLAGATEPDLTNSLAGLYQTKMIIGMALLEGAAFINLVAYIVEKQIWSFGVVGALVLVMVASFPTQWKIENWVEDMKRDLPG